MFLFTTFENRRAQCEPQDTAQKVARFTNNAGEERVRTQHFGSTAQQVIKGLLLVVALYVSGLAYAADEAPGTVPIAEPVEAPVAEPVPESVEAPVEVEKPVPHIALLLPLKSTVFGRAAEAVQRGFMVAANNRPLPMPIKVYGSVDESKDIVALYQYAIANGARAVAGPLTRDGVAALAADPGISVPTLALNTGEAKNSGKLYFFGLPAETEARQAAKLAITANLHSAIIVSNGTPLSMRLSQAFAEEWRSQGGTIAMEILYSDDPVVLAGLPEEPGNMIFLAADSKTARLIHPYLNIATPVYATSQLFNGNADTLTNYDLNNTIFMDMPWLLQYDHPAVMIYPRANPPLETSMERLYALGIDAFRLLQIMLDNSYHTALPMDGVTGLIQLNDSHQFQREAIAGVIKQGRSQLLDPQSSYIAPYLP